MVLSKWKVTGMRGLNVVQMFFWAGDSESVYAQAHAVGVWFVFSVTEHVW